jgi:hypothetical protein
VDDALPVDALGAAEPVEPLRGRAGSAASRHEERTYALAATSHRSHPAGVTECSAICSQPPAIYVVEFDRDEV